MYSPIDATGPLMSLRRPCAKASRPVVMRSTARAMVGSMRGTMEGGNLLPAAIDVKGATVSAWISRAQTLEPGGQQRGQHRIQRPHGQQDHTEFTRTDTAAVLSRRRTSRGQQHQCGGHEQREGKGSRTRSQ